MSEQPIDRDGGTVIADKFSKLRFGIFGETCRQIREAPDIESLSVRKLAEVIRQRSLQFFDSLLGVLAVELNRGTCAGQHNCIMQSVERTYVRRLYVGFRAVCIPKASVSKGRVAQGRGIRVPAQGLFHRSSRFRSVA